jgi:circadian clock protein KaiB
MPAQPWQFRLYVAGQTPKSALALAHLQTICATYLSVQYNIFVIDVLDEPERAAEDRILAVPTLLRIHPEPIRRIVGDLADTERVVADLGL